jgi:hypothetical protein
VVVVLQVEDADTAQARAEELMYGAEEDLLLHYWNKIAVVVN